MRDTRWTDARHLCGKWDSEMWVFSYLPPNFDFRHLWEKSNLTQFLFPWCAQGRGGHAPCIPSLPTHSLLCRSNLHIFNLFWTSFSFVEREILGANYQFHVLGLFSIYLIFVYNMAWKASSLLVLLIPQRGIDLRDKIFLAPKLFSTNPKWLEEWFLNFLMVTQLPYATPASLALPPQIVTLMTVLMSGIQPLLQLLWF